MLSRGDTLSTARGASDHLVGVGWGSEWGYVSKPTPRKYVLWTVHITLPGGAKTMLPHRKRPQKAKEGAAATEERCHGNRPWLRKLSYRDLEEEKRELKQNEKKEKLGWKI